MEKNIFRFMSYVSAFTYGGYCYGGTHGNVPEPYRWILTATFGIAFFVMSLPDKKQ